MEPRDRKDTERTPAFAWWFPRERAVRSLTSNEFPSIAQRASAMRVFPSLEFVGRNESPKRNNDSTMSSPLSLVSPDSLHRLAFDILLHNGVPPDRAEMVAYGLVLADLRGIDTHGINRLEGYITRVKAGVLKPSPPLDFKQVTPVMASLDATNTFGMVAGTLAIDKAIEMARTFGVGMVSVKHSNHFGMAAMYLLRAIDAKFGAFAFTNASRAMPAWGGKEPLLGTGPMAIGLPGGREGNFVLDMSPTVAARVRNSPSKFFATVPLNAILYISG